MANKASSADRDLAVWVDIDQRASDELIVLFRGSARYALLARDANGWSIADAARTPKNCRSADVIGVRAAHKAGTSPPNKVRMSP